jgi:hypothetical protein
VISSILLYICLDIILQDCIHQDLTSFVAAFATDPADFHESLCRRSFEVLPVVGHGTGSVAQRALLSGGTIDNGKIAITWRKSHGVMLRELITLIRFEAGDCVTCYGGFVEPAPGESEHHTHMRHIPSSEYVLNGLPFANGFSTQPGAVSGLGYRVCLSPHCGDSQWDRVIATSGAGYMANTVTQCPQYRRGRPNVTVCEAMLGRVVPGVTYSGVLFLRASAGGIDANQPIISPYEAHQSNANFLFKCMDTDHYDVAGYDHPTTLGQE